MFMRRTVIRGLLRQIRAGGGCRHANIEFGNTTEILTRDRDSHRECDIRNRDSQIDEVVPVGAQGGRYRADNQVALNTNLFDRCPSCFDTGHQIGHSG
jgi:hypothetical protein